MLHMRCLPLQFRALSPQQPRRLLLRRQSVHSFRSTRVKIAVAASHGGSFEPWSLNFDSDSESRDNFGAHQRRGGNGEDDRADGGPPPPGDHGAPTRTFLDASGPQARVEMTPDVVSTLSRLLEKGETIDPRAAPRRSATTLLQTAIKTARNEPWLGRLHPFTLSLLNSLALHLHADGHVATAEVMMREAYVVRRGTLGSDHVDTLTSGHNLAAILHIQGAVSEAEGLCREVLAARRKALGEHHSDTLGTAHNLAAALLRLGRLHEAERIAREVYRARRDALSDQHPATQNTLAVLCYALCKPGTLPEAAALHRRLVHGPDRLLLHCADEAYEALGAGLAPEMYAAAFCALLQERGIPHEDDVSIPVRFLGNAVGECSADCVVGGAVAVVFSAAPTLHDFAAVQRCMSVVRHSSLVARGLAINFGAADGVTLIVVHPPPRPAQRREQPRGVALPPSMLKAQLRNRLRDRVMDGYGVPSEPSAVTGYFISSPDSAAQSYVAVAAPAGPFAREPPPPGLASDQHKDQHKGPDEGRLGQRAQLGGLPERRLEEQAPAGGDADVDAPGSAPPTKQEQRAAAAAALCEAIGALGEAQAEMKRLDESGGEGGGPPAGAAAAGPERRKTAAQAGGYPSSDDDANGDGSGRGHGQRKDAARTFAARCAMQSQWHGLVGNRKAAEAVADGMLEHLADSSAVVAGCACLRALADHGPGACELDLERGLETLVSALKMHPRKSRVVESVLWVLWILCRRIDNQQRAGPAGVIPAVVGAMAQHPHNAGVQEHGCKVLANLAHHYTNCSLISDAGGIEMLVAAIRNNPGSSAVQENASMALANLSVADENEARVADAGGIEAVVAAMRSHPGSPGVQETGIHALLHVNWRCAHSGRIVAAGGAEAIRKAALNYPRLKSRASMALGRLCGVQGDWDRPPECETTEDDESSGGQDEQQPATGTSAECGGDEDEGGKGVDESKASAMI